MSEQNTATATAIPPEDLREQIMSHSGSKNEREWWAMHHIESIERQLAEAVSALAGQETLWHEEVSALRAELDRAKPDIEFSKAMFSACVYLDKAVPVLGRNNAERVRFATDEIMRLRTEFDRVRHATGEFNNDSKNLITVIREMASTIRQQQGLIEDGNKELERLTLERDQLREAVEWQPMDTVPQDGSTVVVLVECFRLDKETSSFKPTKPLGWKPYTHPQPENSL